MIIQLDTVTKHRNSQECRPVNRAKWGDLESVGDGDNLRSIALLMMEAGVVGQVDVYRGKTPVFLGVELEDLAKARLGKGTQPKALRDYHDSNH